MDISNKEHRMHRQRRQNGICGDEYAACRKQRLNRETIRTNTIVRGTSTTNASSEGHQLWVKGTPEKKKKRGFDIHTIETII